MTETMLAELSTNLWIGGRWREASDGGCFEVENPATERTIASVGSATADDCIAAVAVAPDALAGWATTTPRDRGEILCKAHELMIRDGENQARPITMAERLDAGMVGLNQGMVSDPAAPLGGVKQSGLGREGGRDGVLEYLETQYISVDW